MCLSDSFFSSRTHLTPLKLLTVLSKHSEGKIVIKSHLHPPTPFCNPVTFNVNTQPRTNHSFRAGRGEVKSICEKRWESKCDARQSEAWERKKIYTVYYVREKRGAKYQHAFESCSYNKLVCFTYTMPSLTYFPMLCINGKFVWEPFNVSYTRARHTMFCWLLATPFYGLGLVSFKQTRWARPSTAQRQFWNSPKANKCQCYKRCGSSGSKYLILSANMSTIGFSMSGFSLVTYY